MSFKINDRVFHAYDRNATGTVIDISETMVCVQWDNNVDYFGSNPSWWYIREVVRSISSFTSPPPKIEKETQHMSQALWCDKGAHAFSAKDPDREHYTSTRNVKDGNIVTQVTAELDICGACMRDTTFSEVPAISGAVVQDKVPG